MEQKKKSLSIIIGFFTVFIILTLAFGYRFMLFRNAILKIYIPCGMLSPFQEVIDVFSSIHPGLKVQPRYETTNVLVKIIKEQRELPDLFISPGALEMQGLIKGNFIDPKTVRDIGSYNLVLFVPADNPAGITSLQDLAKPEVSSITLAYPNFNSVGSYAKEALVNLGIWEAVEDKCVFTNSPIESLIYVSNKKVQAGIHYDTCPFKTTPEKISAEAIKVIAQIPSQLHSPIRCQIGIASGSKNKKLAQEFIDFLFTDRSKRTLNQYGLTLTEVNQKPSPLILVEAYYPFNEEHIFICDYLKSLEKKYVGKIKVDCIDIRDETGYEKWRKTGLSCGGVIINGRHTFKLPDTKGGSKEVKFLRRLDLYWSRDDFETALKQEIGRHKSAALDSRD